MSSVDIVINYYNPGGSKLLFHQTVYAILRYQANGNHRIILADGSGTFDPEFSKLSASYGFDYVHSDKKLFFAQGYNLGIDYALNHSHNELIVLSANDIFVSANTIQKMVTAVTDRTGCVIPYLSHSDLTIQNEKYSWKTRRPAGMTLNVNLFKRKDLLQIGLVPEEFTGYFNDVVMAYRIVQDLKKEIILVDAGPIIHLGRATTSQNSSANFLRDLEIFRQKYPHLALRNKNMPVNQLMLSQGGLETLTYRVNAATDSAVIVKLQQWLHKALLHGQYVVARLLRKSKG